MTAPRHRIGLIGLGLAIGPHARSLVDLSPRAEVVAAYSPTAERRRQFATAFPFPTTGDLAAVLADRSIDAVAILAPPAAHLELVEQAAAAGKHILIEKPLEITTARAERLVAAAEAAGVTLAVTLQHRFRPSAEQATAVVGAGRLGRIVSCSTSIRLWRPQSYYDQPGRGTLARDGGGVLLTQGIHTLDLMLSLAGPIDCVTGFATTSSVHRMEAEDLVTAAVRFRSGALGVIDATTAAFPGFPERIEMAGEGGSLVLAGSSLKADLADGGTIEVKPDGSAGGTGADPMAFPHDWHKGVWTDFLDALETGRRPRVGGRQALVVHRLIDALIATGAAGGRLVDVAG
jgi:predicted dehydrogenase